MLAVYIVVLTAWAEFMFLVGLLFEEPMIRYLNRIWLPKGWDSKVIPGRKSRTEMVVLSSKWGTTYLETVIHVAFAFVAGPVVGFVLEIVRVPVVNVVTFMSQGVYDPVKPSIFLAAVWTLLIFSTIPFGYWVAEWKRRSARIVILTDQTFFVKARPAWLPFFTFGIIVGNDPRISHGPSNYLKEVIIDRLERLGGRQTPWLLDQIYNWLSAKRGVSSVFWPSQVMGAADTSKLHDHANGVVRCANAIGARAEELAKELAVYPSQLAIASMGNLTQEYNEETIRKNVQELISRRDKAYPAPTEDDAVDLFREQDPGLWNRVTGLPIEVEETVVETDFSIFTNQAS